MTAPGKPLDLDGMEAVARAATQGEWRSNYEHVWARGYRVSESPWDLTGDRPAKQCFSDARHIATFDPLTVLALIQTQRELVACVTRNRAALDLIDPMRPLQYATTMDLMRKDMSAAIASATDSPQ